MHWFLEQWLPQKAKHGAVLIDIDKVQESDDPHPAPSNRRLWPDSLRLEAQQFGQTAKLPDEPWESRAKEKHPKIHGILHNAATIDGSCLRRTLWVRETRISNT